MAAAVIAVVAVALSGPPARGSAVAGPVVRAADTAVALVDPAAAGRLAGSFVQPWLVDGWSDSTLAAELADLRSLRMSRLILQWSANSNDDRAGGLKTATYPTALPGYAHTTATDVVGRTLTAADAAGVDVWVGLTVSDAWWRVYATDARWLGDEATTARAVARELWDRYHHHPSFRGWYLPFEVDNVNFAGPGDADNLTTFYRAVVGELRAIDADLPVAIAPFFNAVDTQSPGWQSPTAWGHLWSRILRQVDVDVIALQDGVGAGHATPAQLSDWFAAMREAITAAGSAALLFADTETFTTGPSGFRPMPIRDVVAAIRAVAPYVHGYWSFSFTHYQSPRAPFGTDAYWRAYAAWVDNPAGDGDDGDLPSRPNRVAARSGAGAVTLTWAASRDAGSGVAGYHVYRDGQPIADVFGTTTRYVDRTAVPGRTYTYRVRAFDGSGNESPPSWPAQIRIPR